MATTTLQPSTGPNRVPSRKWLATQVTAVAALLTAYVTAGSWNQTLSIAVIGVVAQAIIGYLLPNAEPAADGVVDTATDAKVRQRRTTNTAGPYGALAAGYLATRGGRVKAR